MNAAPILFYKWLAAEVDVIHRFILGCIQAMLLIFGISFPDLLRAERSLSGLKQNLCAPQASDMERLLDNGEVKSWNIDLWNGSDEKGFASLDHPGYTLESNSITHVGGWHAHRAVWEQAKLCWMKEEVVDMIARVDYITMPIGRAPRILVLYGSLNPKSFNRKLAYEFARLLDLLGCDVRIYNPKGLPIRDPTLENHVKVQELRALSRWSDGHMWVCPEMHGTTTSVFKNQIDWIPLNTESRLPTKGKTCCVAQANRGCQSFDSVNAMRLLARWMQMPCCTLQSSIPNAWQVFDDDGRMEVSSYRDEMVDVAEEFVKFTSVIAPLACEVAKPNSERKGKKEVSHLLTQAEQDAIETNEESKK